MNMGAAAGALKEAANEDFLLSQDYSANRANPIPFSQKAVNATLDVHEPVLSAVQGRKSRGFYQLSFPQFS